MSTGDLLNDVCGAGAVQCFAFSLFPSATSVAATFPVRGRSSAAGGSLSVGAAQTLHRGAESRTALPRCLPHQLRPPAAGGPHPSRCSAKAQHRATFPKGKAKHCHYHCTTPLQKCAATGVTPVHLCLTKKASPQSGGAFVRIVSQVTILVAASVPSSS